MSLMTNYTSATALTTTIPRDTSTPLVTEGTEIFSEAYTAENASSKLHIEVVFNGDTSTTFNEMSVAIFDGSTCIGAGETRQHITSWAPMIASVAYEPGDTASHTYSVRVGIKSGTLTINNTTNGFTLNGTLTGYLKITDSHSDVAQRKTVRNTTEYSFATQIPEDNTTPLVTEGTEIFSEAFTPTSGSNEIYLYGYVQAKPSANAQIIVAVFQGSTCVASFEERALSAYTKTVPFGVKLSAADTSSRTYSVRVGTGSAVTTLYVNSQSGDGLNNVEGSLLQIEENTP